MVALAGVLLIMYWPRKLGVAGMNDANAEKVLPFASEMNTTPLTTIAPDIFRKRLLIEGYFESEVTAETLRTYFSHITVELGLRTYSEPIIHRTGGEGKEVNQGFDGFVPLIDLGFILPCGSIRSFCRLRDHTNATHQSTPLYVTQDERDEYS